MTIYVTRWALGKQGILEVDVPAAEVRMARHGTGRLDALRYATSLTADEWHTSLESAREQVRCMRIRRVAALRRQIARLTELDVAAVKVTRREA
jgi:hypothetical protein